MMMIASLLVLTLMHAVESLVVQLRAHAEECFFVASASRLGATCVVAWQTQLGAVLEIDVDIHDPREQLIYSAMMAPEGQTSFAAGAGGRYRVCFSNVNNGQYPKFVAFRIQCHELPDEVEQEMPQREEGQRRKTFFFFFHRSPRCTGREGDGGQRQNPISYHMLPNLAQKGTGRSSVLRCLLTCTLGRPRRQLGERPERARLAADEHCG
jgi:hypothetical protein